MLVLVNLPYYCPGANLRRYTNIQPIQEKCLNMFAHTLYLNRELGEGWGGGGAHFCDPVIQHFFLLSMNRDVLKNCCML